jgi:hypothetical protein
MRWRPVLVGLAAVVLGAGAGAGVQALRGGSGDGTPAAGDLRLRATAEQWRTNEVQRTVAVALHNDGPVPVRVSRVELVFPSFAGAAASDTDALLPPNGLRVDVPLPYGTGTCTDLSNTAPAAAPAEVIVDARPDGGATSRVRLALPYPNALLDKLLRDDCVQQRLNRSVVLSFGPWTNRADGTLAGHLILTAGPARDAAVDLLEINGSIHTLVRPADPAAKRPLITLPATTASVTLPVIADASRCDPHAVAEAKKPFEFPAFLSVGGGAEIATTLPVTEADKLALDRMLRTRCKPG